MTSGQDRNLDALMRALDGETAKAVPGTLPKALSGAGPEDADWAALGAIAGDVAPPDDLFGRIQIDRETENHQVLAAAFFPQRFEHWHLDFAGRTPGRPEIEQDGAPFKIGERDRVSLPIGERRI